MHREPRIRTTRPGLASSRSERPRRQPESCPNEQTYEPGTNTVISEDFRTSVSIAQSLQTMNGDAVRDVDVIDLFGGVFLWDPELVIPLAGSRVEILKYLTSDCRIAKPYWWYHHQFCLLQQGAKAPSVQPFCGPALDVLAMSESLATDRWRPSYESSVVEVTMYDLMQAIFAAPRPVGPPLAWMGFTRESIRFAYSV
jgi:hypothetical protein